MESLFEVLYRYAVENRCALLSPEEHEEQELCEDMLCRAMEELTAQGCGELAQQVESGAKSLACSGRGCPSAWNCTGCNATPPPSAPAAWR